jgi:spore germination protein GerM
MIKNPDAARRLARAIASDVSLYNQEKIQKGIQQDNFFEILATELEEGRSHYNSKVDPEILATTNFYDLAIIDVILKRNAHIQSKIW